MRIVKIEIDGFKSYGQYQALDKLDPQFNAITGLNGSGKSNILDSICFLLGITHLQYIRAENNEELVFKKGQGGITKATVTITFDNSDPKHCPIGYENEKLLVIRRQVMT
jgi:structural maintenance of chromosome 2